LKLSDLPKGKRAIGCKWVFTKKQGSSDGDTEHCKARLVVIYAQREGINYNEVFSPVVKHSSIQILLALVAQYELKLDQLDVKTTFLHDNLEEKIYMSQPMEFKIVGKENMVCKLKKSLYGLKQSPRQWYKHFDSIIRGKKYTRSHYDPCVTINYLEESTSIYSCMWMICSLLLKINLLLLN